MKATKVCILGGTGFVGRHLAAALASRGLTCRILSRHPQRHRRLLTIEKVTLEQIDLFDSKRLIALFDDCDAVINLIGILNESGTAQNFQLVHIELGDLVVEACKQAGVERLLHMSALNASETNGCSQYLKSKGEAESRAHTLGQPQIKVTSFRPSVIFGHDDSFFNRFAGLLKTLPGPFPLACPNSRFAPVYVGDVANAFSMALDDKESWGRHYELCGPRIFTLRELVEYTANALSMRKKIIGLGDNASRLQARMLSLVPGKPFSYDNYLSLQTDSVCSEQGLEALGIQATDIDAVVPFFLSGKSERGRYARHRCCG